MNKTTILACCIMLALSITACEKPYIEEEEDAQEKVDDKTDKENTDSGNGSTNTGENKDEDGQTSSGDTLSVAEFRQKSFKYPVYVVGYVVGAATGKGNRPRFEFQPPFSYDTAILIADTKEASSKDEVIAVCLTSCSKKVRSALNLKDNPDNNGQQILVHGYKETYLKIPGIKEVTAYAFPFHLP